MIPDLFAHAAASAAARVPLSSDEAQGAAEHECTPDFLADLLAALTQAAPGHATDGSAVAPPADVWLAGLTSAALPAVGPEALAADAEQPSEPSDENEGLVVPVLLGDGTAAPAVVVAVDAALSTGPPVPAREGPAGLPVDVARDREGSNLPSFAGDSAQRMPHGAARPDVGLGSHVKIPHASAPVMDSSAPEPAVPPGELSAPGVVREHPVLSVDIDRAGLPLGQTGRPQGAPPSPSSTKAAAGLASAQDTHSDAPVTVTTPVGEGLVPPRGTHSDAPVTVTTPVGGPPVVEPSAETGNSDDRGHRHAPQSFAGADVKVGPDTAPKEMPAPTMAAVDTLARAAAQPTPAVQPPADSRLQAGPQAEAENLARLVESMRVQWRQHVPQAVVRLKPEHLGEVTISIRVDRGAVSAVVHAEAPAVQQWLEAQEDRLRSGLADQGLNLERFLVHRDRPQQQREQRQPPSPRYRQPRDTGLRFDVTA